MSDGPRSSRCPGLFAGVGLAFGLSLALWAPPPWWILLLSLPLGVMGVVRRPPISGWMGTASALGLVVLGGWWWYPVGGGDVLNRLAGVRFPGYFLGEVAGEPRIYEGRSRFEVSVHRWGPDSLTAHRGSGRVLVFLQSEASPRSGDVVRVRGKLSLPRGYANPALFDYRTYLLNRGVVGVIAATPDAVTTQRRASVLSLEGVIRHLRRASMRVLDEHKLTPAFSLLSGLILGQRWKVHRHIQETFAEAGLAHVMAISGLHVGFVAAAVFPVLRALRAGRRGAAIGTAVALVLYAWLTGGRPSVVRATVMACILIAGLLTQRSWSPLNSLGIAALVILGASPRSLVDPGFQLSFLATGSILLLCPPLVRRLPGGSPWRVPVAALAVSVSAQAGVLLLVARYFHRVHVVAPLANLVVVPVVGLGVALGLATVAAGSVSHWLADIFAHANLLPLEFSVRAARWLGGLPSAGLAAHPPGLGACAPYFLGLGALGLALRRRRSWLWILATGLVVISVVLWWGGSLAGGGLEVTVLDVGEGDSIFIKAPGGGTLLIDAGLRTRYTDMGAVVVLPFLQAQGVRTLDCVLLTHAHNDHVGGVPTVIGGLKIGRAFGTGFPHTSWSYRRYVRCLREKGVPWARVREGDVIPVGEARLHVLYPRDSDVALLTSKPDLGLNTISVVARLVYKNFSMLLAGDAEELVERAVLRRGHVVRARVLKVGHHGAATSSTESFLRAVSPEVAVVSAGRSNRFGHPHVEALARLRRAGCRVYRTDVHGAVVVTSDGQTYKIRTTRPLRRSAEWHDSVRKAA
jgi:competence protein ComEC